MAQLGKKIVFDVGEGDDAGLIVLNQPTNKQWNDYQTDKWNSQSDGRDVDATNKVICEFFDTLIDDIKNIQDSDGSEITKDSLSKINIKEKTSMIMQGIELNNQGIVLKN